MTTLTMRMVKGDFIVTGPDIEPMKFKTRREAKDWCAQHTGIADLRDWGGRFSAGILVRKRAFAPKGPRSAKRDPEMGRSWKRWTETKRRPLLKKRTPATS